MSAAEQCFDTNVLLYLLSADTAKADLAEQLVATGGTISVQVLNEFASVASRKLRMSWADIGDALEAIRAVCTVVPVTLQSHQDALRIAARYGLSFYDALIVASALQTGCTTLHSEGMQHGQTIDRKLRIRNPFVAMSRPDASNFENPSATQVLRRSQ
jgi:predicted nucleic acid-binding protein